MRAAEKLASCDPIWSALRVQAEELAVSEPELASFAHATILKHDRLEDALSYHLARKLGGEDLSPLQLREIFAEAFVGDKTFGEAVRADLAAVYQRDPACHCYAQAFLFFKGFHALECHRVAHFLWTGGRQLMALFIQNRMSDLFAPGSGNTIVGNTTGVVIGKTAVVGDDVSMLHGVTLGGTGKQNEDRHPKIGRGVLLSVGAKVLGNIQIGEYSRVGAGSVVLKPVPPYTTVAGVPARVIGQAGSPRPSQDMNHDFPEEPTQYPQTRRD